MKYLFVIINCTLLTLAAFLLVQAAYQRTGLTGVSESRDAAGTPQSAEADKKMIKSNSFQQQYSIIGSRNLFHVLTDEKTTETASLGNQARPSKTIKTTPLQLSLRGTVTGLSQVYAVIEDKKKRKQDLYAAGDSIQDAFLKAVYKDYVILEYNGEDQRLDMNVEVNTFSGNMPEMPSVPDPLPDETEQPEASELMSQARFRIHSSNGQIDGLVIIGIKPGSVFRKMGLLNGDIIKGINDRPVQAAEEALSLFQAMMDENTGQIAISRRGQEKSIVYRINQDNEE